MLAVKALSVRPYLLLIHSQDHVQAGFEHFAPVGPLAQFLAAVSLVVAAPFSEELFFRGVLFNALAVRMRPLWAAVVSGLLFALAHGDALVYQRTRNLGAVMLMHGAGNALAAISLPF